MNNMDFEFVSGVTICHSSTIRSRSRVGLASLSGVETRP